MKYKDVHIEPEGVTLTLYKSKTEPRLVYLSEEPKLLLRWLGNHPLKNKEDAPLWLSSSPNSYMKQIKDKSISRKFKRLVKKAGIEKPLTLHCFRKTRATIMFNATSKDGGHLFNDAMIGKMFGWEPETVHKRRFEYDLTTDKQLKEKMFSIKPKTIQTYDDILREKEKIETKQREKINDLEFLLQQVQQQNEDLKNTSVKMITELQKQVKILTEQFKIFSNKNYKYYKNSNNEKMMIL